MSTYTVTISVTDEDVEGGKTFNIDMGGLQAESPDGAQADALRILRDIEPGTYFEVVSATKN